MAEKKDDKGLIGFDPLAWMNESDVDNAGNVDNTDEIQPNEEVLVEPLEQPEDEASEIIAEPINETEAKTIDDSKLILDATLNIQNVSRLYEQLTSLLETQDQIEIDASEVVSIDASTLQLLIVLKQTAIKLHKEVIIDFPTDKFIESAELLGLAEMLDVDQAAAGLF